jgi:hypothetical protein
MTVAADASKSQAGSATLGEERGAAPARAIALQPALAKRLILAALTGLLSAPTSLCHGPA